MEALWRARVRIPLPPNSASSRKLREATFGKPGGFRLRHQHPYPLRGCNSDLAQYSNTPARNASRSDAGGPTLHHSAGPDSRTTTRTRTKRLVNFGAVAGSFSWGV